MFISSFILSLINVNWARVTPWAINQTDPNPAFMRGMSLRNRLKNKYLSNDDMCFGKYKIA